MLTVVFWLWHDESFRWRRHYTYGPDHVNRLARRVSEHLRIPHRFACITDNPGGIDSSIDIIPLWTDGAEFGGCWRRLRAFSGEMAQWVGERFLWLDLDTVIVGDLTPLVDRPDDFVILRDWIWPRAIYNGSMVLMTTGSRERVWTEFEGRVSVERVRKSGLVGTDQAWYALTLGRDEQTWSEADGLYSYRWHVEQGGLPPDSRAVFFHGPFHPSMPTIRKRHSWVVRCA